MTGRLHENYKSAITKSLQSKFEYENVMEIPKIIKIVVNMGLGEAVKDTKKIEIAQKELSAITGQFPVVTRAKKANASFKLRAGMSIGLKVTLRRQRMYEFLDRLINIAFPRIRDFRGLNSKSFDGNGNFSLGIKEHIIFPEINFDKIDKVRGLDITICTSAINIKEAFELLKSFNMPLR